MAAPRSSTNARTTDIRIGGRPVEIAAHNCFACGSLNTHGLQLQLHAANGRCWTEVALADRFEGWQGIAHGGIVCTILDEVMAWALIETDAWGVTVRMNVAFRRPVPVGVPLRAEGWVVDAGRRLMQTEARLVDVTSGVQLATATGAYVAAPADRKAELKARYRFRLGDPVPTGYGPGADRRAGTT